MRVSRFVNIPSATSSIRVELVKAVLCSDPDLAGSILVQRSNGAARQSKWIRGIACVMRDVPCAWINPYQAFVVSPDPNVSSSVFENIPDKHGAQPNRSA